MQLYHATGSALLSGPVAWNTWIWSISILAGYLVTMMICLLVLRFVIRKQDRRERQSESQQYGAHYGSALASIERGLHYLSFQQGIEAEQATKSNRIRLEQLGRRKQVVRPHKRTTNAQCVLCRRRGLTLIR